MPIPPGGPPYEEFERRDEITVTNVHGLPVYIDSEGRKCPTASAIIKRMESQGRIHPPLYSTDGYERTAERPELIWWYSRIVGELAHDRIAARVDNTYDGDVHAIARRIRNRTGVEADDHEVKGELYRYRDSNVRSILLEQAEEDVKALISAWESWWGTRFNDLDPIRAELRIIREHPRKDARWGVRPDLLAVDERDDEVVGVCIKTTHEITDAHRVQAVATLHASPHIDRVVIVRLDREYGRTDREMVTVEDERDRESPYSGLYSDFRREAVRAYRAIN